MSPARKFDRFMVEVHIGTNRKLRRLPVAQRWVFVAGVLSIAAQSPRRGALLIADDVATDEDIALQATVPVKEAKAAMTALRRLRMLERDADGVEWVHDWDDLNPSPKADPTNAERQARYRRNTRGNAVASNGSGNGGSNGRNAGSNAPRNATEVEVEVGSTPPCPPRGEIVIPPKSNRKRDNLERSTAILNLARSLYDDETRQAYVSAAIGQGAKTVEDVRAYVERWCGMDDLNSKVIDLNARAGR